MGLTFSFQEIEDALLKLNKNAKNTLADKALDAGKKPMLKELDKNVPIDTGELSDSLDERERTGNGVNRKVHLGSTSNEREVIERAYYQEHGNSSMMGKKWMKRSFQNSKDRSLQAMSDAIAEEILK